MAHEIRFMGETSIGLWGNVYREVPDGCAGNLAFCSFPCINTYASDGLAFKSNINNFMEEVA